MSLMVEKLAYLKKQCHLTNQQTASLSHIPVGTLNKIFSGQTKHPAAEHLDKLSRVFRVPIHYLLDNDLPTECCFSAAAEEQQELFCLSAEEVRVITYYRRLDAEDRHTLVAMASLLRAPASSLAGSVPVRRTLCYTAPTRGGSPIRPILLPKTDAAVGQADFAVQLQDQCMEPIYPQGSVLLCRRENAGREEYGLYRWNQELLLRRLVRRRGVTRLVAPGLAFRDIVVAEHDFLACLGRITGCAHSYRWE